MQFFMIVIVLLLLNAVNADECGLDEVEPDCQAYCYSSVKPFLSYIPSMQKRIEACEIIKPNYDSEKIDKIDKQLAEHVELMKSMQNQIVSCTNLQKVESKLESMENQFKQQVESCMASSRSTEETLKEQRNLKDECQNALKSTISLQSQLVDRSSLENVKSKLKNMENQLKQEEGLVESCRASIKVTEGSLAQQRSLTQQCQNERRKFKKIGDKYYHIEYFEERTWISALQRCAEWGGHLVSFQSADELYRVTRNIKPGRYFWTDLYDLESEGTFISATTGKPPRFVKWIKNEPNNHYWGTEDCVELGHTGIYEMNDTRCHLKMNFICEADDESVIDYS